MSSLLSVGVGRENVHNVHLRLDIFFSGTIQTAWVSPTDVTKGAFALAKTFKVARRLGGYVV